MFAETMGANRARATRAYPCYPLLLSNTLRSVKACLGGGTMNSIGKLLGASLPPSAFLLLLFSYTSTAAAQVPGTFTPTAKMSAPRFSHTATLLLNGEVLITGGSQPTQPGGKPLASAELFDPKTRTFTP